MRREGIGMGRGIDRESGFYEFYQVFFIREFYWILNCLLNVIFKIRTLILAEKINRTSSQSQKHSKATSQAQISVIQSQN